MLISGAAGVAGAIKAMLAVEHGELPPTINFDSLNPHIRLAGTPFAVNTALKPWPRPADGPRRAAVSAFGFSGTNAHVVVEQSPAQPSTPGQGPWLFPLSARTPGRLAEYAGVLERFVAARPDLAPADIALTLQAGRKPQAARAVIEAADRAALLRGLAAIAAGQTPAAPADAPADALARRWLAGETVRWPNVGGARRRHLPGVPFARDRYWIEPPLPAAHPLPERVRVHGDEDFLTAQVDGDCRLSLGLFLPEMARASAERHAGRPVRGLARLLWGAPVRVNGTPRRFETVMDEDESGLFYRVVVDGDDDAPCHLGEVLEQAPVPVPLTGLEDGADVTPSWRDFAGRLAVHSGPPAAAAPAVLSVRRLGGAITARLRRGTQGAPPFDPLLLDAAWRLFAFAAGTCPMAFPHAVESLWAARDVPTEFVVRAGGDTLVVAAGDGTPCLIATGLRLGRPEDLAEIRFAEETPS